MKPMMLVLHLTQYPDPQLKKTKHIVYQGNVTDPSLL